MKISIITATYNSSETVFDTLESVANQSYHDIEHIIVDGLSVDNTLDIVQRFKHNVHIKSGKDGGIYDAMNKGILFATGDIIGILNSDDFYENSSVLSKIAEAFNDNSVDAVYGDLQYVDAKRTTHVVRTWKSGKYTRKSFYYGWMPPHPTFFVRRAVYEKFGLFNTQLRSSADYELMMRILLKHALKAVYIPEVLVKMRTGGMSNASLKNRLRANKEDRLAWKLNDLEPYFFTLYLKPLRKISQFIRR